jgi:hypothetical protein
MSDEPDKRSRGWIWGPSTLIVLLALYIGGYFVQGGEGIEIHKRSVARCYRSSVVAHAYVPLGILESKILRRDVYLSFPGERSFETRMFRYAP